MSRTTRIPAVPLAIGLAATVLVSCSGPKPFVLEGDANTVEVAYSGDVATTLPLARRHCAQFEREPRLIEPGFDSAVYDCVRP